MKWRINKSKQHKPALQPTESTLLKDHTSLTRLDNLQSTVSSPERSRRCLPVEILEAILESIAKHEQLSLCTSSIVLYDLAIPLLYRDIWFYSSSQLVQCYAVLKAKESHAVAEYRNWFMSSCHTSFLYIPPLNLWTSRRYALSASVIFLIKMTCWGYPSFKSSPLADNFCRHSGYMRST